MLGVAPAHAGTVNGTAAVGLAASAAAPNDVVARQRRRRRPGGGRQVRVVCLGMACRPHKLRRSLADNVVWRSRVRRPFTPPCRYEALRHASSLRRRAQLHHIELQVPAQDVLAPGHPRRSDPSADASAPPRGVRGEDGGGAVKVPGGGGGDSGGGGGGRAPGDAIVCTGAEVALIPLLRSGTSGGGGESVGAAPISSPLSGGGVEPKFGFKSLPPALRASPLSPPSPPCEARRSSRAAAAPVGSRHTVAKKPKATAARASAQK